MYDIVGAAAPRVFMGSLRGAIAIARLGTHADGVPREVHDEDGVVLARSIPGADAELTVEGRAEMAECAGSLPRITCSAAR